jgi:hypothetical protein
MTKASLFLCLVTVALAAATAAGAKTIQMGALSRSVIQSACARADGTAFGLDDEHAVYGCSSGLAAISCSPADSTCEAIVADMRPVTGNALGYILGIAQPTTASRIQPLDARVAPRYRPQTGTVQRVAQ